MRAGWTILNIPPVTYRSMSGIYRPAEDSHLLLRHALERAEGVVLDMGTGSGVVAVEIAALEKVERVLAADIDPRAIDEAQKRAHDAGVSAKMEFVRSDLFENIVERQFDWILFNPPYLPAENGADESSWSGGDGGGEVTIRFLRDAPEHLAPGGRILLIVSSKTGIDMDKVRRAYRIETLEEVPLFFEVLRCLLLKPASLSGAPDRNRPRKRPRTGRGR